MEKISVLIPTIQKNIGVFYKLLNVLKADEAVGEILIINNALTEFPDFVEDEKIKVYTPSENLYVNSAWNIGVRVLENDKFLIINDDILCCENFCSKILETKILDYESTGLVGLDEKCIVQNNRETVTDISVPVSEDSDTIGFIGFSNYLNTGDWGSAFFGRKECYHQIPFDLKIIYGDNYLLYKNIQNSKRNYKISGLKFNHIHSLSSADPQFSSIIASDMKNQKKYFQS